jgi:alpha-galactosidase
VKPHPALIALSLLVVAFTPACKRQPPKPKAAPFQPSTIKVEIKSGGPLILTTSSTEFQVQPSGYIQAFLLRGEQRFTLDEPKPGSPSDSEYIIQAGKPLHFVLAFDQARELESLGKFGPGKRMEIPGHPLGPAGASVLATLAIEVYDAFPNLLLSSVEYKNTGSADFVIDQVIAQEHRFSAQLADPKAHPYDMWSFEGSSFDSGNDDVVRLNPASSAAADQSLAGKNASSAGIPVLALWTANVGEAIGHVEPLPLAISLSCHVAADDHVVTELNLPVAATLRPGESYFTPRTFLSIYSGDFYQPLHIWSDLHRKENWNLPKPAPDAYSVGWSGPAHQPDLTPSAMLGMIPELKALGIKWATLDDGWFDTYGDWNPRPDAFSGDSIRKMTADFHRQGLLIQLGWLPLAVQDGQGSSDAHSDAVSRIVQQHPDWLILDQDGAHARVSHNLAALCPALPGVQAYYLQLVQEFIHDWDFDGFRLDTIHSVPKCYNPAHHHSSPQDSLNAVAEIYKIIYQTSHALKPQSLTQAGPGAASLASLPYIDLALASAPQDLAQLRRRIKMYKALYGPEAPITGDPGLSASDRPARPRHDYDEDFASTVGVGAVFNGNFALSKQDHEDTELTPRTQQLWKKWLTLYNEKMLAKGDFLDLYTYGYDLPEAYAISNNRKMYYAFFAPKPNAPLKTQVELRGLKPGHYQIMDYVTGRKYGAVEATPTKTPRLSVEFTNHLLLEASP